MLVYSTLESLPDPAPPVAAAFGNFDGVHLGHRELLATVVAAARTCGGPAAVVTFDPHPLAVLRPDRAPAALDGVAQRLVLLADCGIDWTLVLPFDAALAARSPQWFVRQLLCGRLGVRAVVAGPGVRFGHGGAGDLRLLQEELHRVHGLVHPCAGVEVGGVAVSSTRIREAVAAGDVASATLLLGRPFALRGRVVEGDRRGRTLGFPTANLDVTRQVIPAHGVYAGWFESGGVRHAAVANVGVRPTFGASERRIEAHVLDFAGDLYGASVALHFVDRLRGELRFDGIDALRGQIARDTAAARAVLGSIERKRAAS